MNEPRNPDTAPTVDLPDTPMASLALPPDRIVRAQPAGDAPRTEIRHPLQEDGS